ncbi:astacin-like metalloendopeptidase [Hemicordylus capensis]|uniref:astacin-like metalloendopeptidase n=1 Tax=Hemicordylus capensis TaxID=884348 RepID=UPI002302A667|nr:astacin-like metalloendopeptidase [Hemicordylus capensis]
MEDISSGTAVDTEASGVISLNGIDCNTVYSRVVTLLSFAGPNFTGQIERKDIFTEILKANQECKMPLDEGDIARPRARNAIICTGNSCLWSKSSDEHVNIPYVISTNYTEDQKNILMNAMQDVNTRTCVRFVERSSEMDYVDIKPETGCWSYIGKIGGPQSVVLSANCMTKRIIQHELNHAMGMLHEHNRSDRDKHVKVMWQYINPGDRGSFNLENANTLDLPYDYSSVMHYGRFDYTNSPGKATLVPIPDASVPIGESNQLSNLDIAKINKLYDCKSTS